MLMLICFIVNLFWQATAVRTNSGHTNAVQSTQQGARNSDLTISYDIEIKSKKKNPGIAETYNGGVETIFLNDSQARMRLVSLMRMQDIFLNSRMDARGFIAMVKESGKNKYVDWLSRSQWKKYNRKYDGATCAGTGESILLLRHKCFKSIVTLTSGDQITVYYTADLHSKLIPGIEPAFSCVPGLVLKYEYRYKKSTITYTASSLSTDPIDPSVFTVPTRGFAERKVEF